MILHKDITNIVRRADEATDRGVTLDKNHGGTISNNYLINS